MSSHPVNEYIASLSGRSQRYALRWLNFAADRASGGISNALQFRWEKVDRQQFERIEWHAAEELHPSSAIRIVSSVRGVLLRCAWMNLMSTECYEDAIGATRGSTNAPSAVERLLRHDLQAALELCEQGRLEARRLRDRALVSLVLGYGLEAKEAASLDLLDYELLADESVITEEAEDAVQSWVILRGGLSGPLLHPIGPKGEIIPLRMSADSVYSVLKRLGRKLAPAFAPETKRSRRKSNARAPRGGIQACPVCGGFVCLGVPSLRTSRATAG